MSPLDDELRAALHGRATALAPSPDPLAGIERRAKRLQRNRIGAAVAGSVLAVAAVAAVVPALQQTAAQPNVPRVGASIPPSPQTSHALDPQRPWAFRGTPVDEGTSATVLREYALRHPDSLVTVTPLFAQVYEPSAQLEVVFLAEVDGAGRWGVAVSGESGPEFPVDEELAEGQAVLAAALPGDEQARLLVVTSPEAVSIDYGPDGGSDFSAMGELARGVAVVALSGDATTDRVRVRFPDGAVTVPAPDAEQPAAQPDNLLDWPSRGTELTPDLDAAVLTQFRAALPGLAAEPQDTGVRYRPLFTGDTDGGVRYTFGQAWAVGGSAYTVGVAEGGTEGAQFFLGPKTDPGSRVLSYLLCCQPGSTVDTLVVVPQPGTGQVLYATGPQSELRPVGTGQDALDGVVLVDRDRRADGDRLRLLDGDGDLDRPSFDGAVRDLLCGVTSCS